MESVLPEVFLRHRTTLLAIAKRTLRNPAHAEDMVQQTVLRAWSARSSFRGDAQVSTWLTRILYNEIWQFQRRADEQRLEFCDDWTAVEAATFDLQASRFCSPERDHAVAEIRRLLRRMVATLPAAYRDVLLLDLYTEMSTEQKSIALNLTIPAVKSRSMRGRSELIRRFRHVLRLPLPASTAKEVA